MFAVNKNKIQSAENCRNNTSSEQNVYLVSSETLKKKKPYPPNLHNLHPTLIIIIFLSSQIKTLLLI
jgi:hypothetical protein